MGSSYDGLLPTTTRMKHMYMLKHLERILVPILLVVMLGGAYAYVQYASMDLSGTYTIESGITPAEAGSFQGQFTQTTPDNSTIFLDIVAVLPVLHTGNFRLSADDCLEELTINDVPIQNEVPFCDYEKGKILDLSHALHAGSNTIRATVRNNGGPASFTMHASLFDARMLLPPLIILVAIMCMLLLRCARITARTANTSLLIAAATALALRGWYVLNTSYNTRGYDTDGHIEYIRHILEHWSIPAAVDGWQFYQPPLYYLLAALPAGLAHVLGGDEPSTLFMVQLFSFFLSCASVVLASWIVVQLFPKKTQSSFATLAFALYAFFPATILLSSRINNDVLLEFLGLACIGSLIAWWIGRDDSWWYASILTFSLALLTKSNALLLAPIIGVCLLLKPRLSMMQRLRLGGITIALLLVLNGWYVALRAFEGQTHIVANLTNLNSALRLDTAWENMAEFNPIRVVMQPYNNPWDDAHGRQHFWEYLFRSAFTGEFSFGDRLAPVVSTALGLGLIVFLFSLIGGWHVLRERILELLPLWLTPITLLLGHAAYRQFVAPYSSSQDFRYSLLAVLPLAILAVQGMGYLPQAKQRWPHALGWSFVVCSSIFLFSVIAA